MNSNFESQNSIIIQRLMNKGKMSREQALKYWFGSRTYSEIMKRNLTYISAMRACYELELEKTNNPDWMKNSFDI